MKRDAETEKELVKWLPAVSLATPVVMGATYIGMIQHVDSAVEWHHAVNGTAAAYAGELKAEGKIKHIGLSSHNPKAALESVRSGLSEVLMLGVDRCYGLQSAAENVENLRDDERYCPWIVQTFCRFAQSKGDF